MFRFHEVNLALPPFYFPAPACQAPDATPSQYYALWRLEDLLTFASKNREMIRQFTK